MGAIFRLSQTPEENEQVGAVLLPPLLPTSVELLPDPAEALSLDQGQGSVLCHTRGLHSLMIKLNSTIIWSSDS